MKKDVELILAKTFQELYGKHTFSNHELVEDTGLVCECGLILGDIYKKNYSEFKEKMENWLTTQGWLVLFSPIGELIRIEKITNEKVTKAHLLKARITLKSNTELSGYIFIDFASDGLTCKDGESISLAMTYDDKYGFYNFMQFDLDDITIMEVILASHAFGNDNGINMRFPIDKSVTNAYLDRIHIKDEDNILFDDEEDDDEDGDDKDYNDEDYNEEDDEEEDDEEDDDDDEDDDDEEDDEEDDDEEDDDDNVIKPCDDDMFLSLFTCLRKGFFVCLIDKRNAKLRPFYKYLCDNLENFMKQSRCDAISFYITCKNGERSHEFISFSMDQYEMNVTKGGYIYTEGYGGDSYTDWSFDFYSSGTEYEYYQYEEDVFEAFTGFLRSRNACLCVEYPSDYGLSEFYLYSDEEDDDE